MEEPQISQADQAPTEIDWLAADIATLTQHITENPGVFKGLGDTEDLDRQNRLYVFADLAWKGVLLAHGVEVLLRKELHAPSIAILRAMFENATNTRYLAKREDQEKEAATYIAFSHFKQIDAFEGSEENASAVRQLQDALRRIPQTCVDEARRRKGKRPYTWSGKTIRRMAEEADVQGYDTTYGYMASDFHGGIIGQHVTLTHEKGEKTGTLTFGRPITQRDLHSRANLARRLLLGVFYTMWEAVGGTLPIPLSSPDPEDFRRTDSC